MVYCGGVNTGFVPAGARVTAQVVVCDMSNFKFWGGGGAIVMRAEMSASSVDSFCKVTPR